jgi:hypothetical protein
MDNSIHERAIERMKEGVKGEGATGFPVDIGAKASALMDAVMDFVIESAKGDSAWRFLSMMICYQSLYLVGQIGEQLLRKAFTNDLDKLDACRKQLQDEIAPVIRRFDEGLG